MHTAYKANAGEEITKKPATHDDETEDDGLDIETSVPVPEKINSSRLTERLANFDARTNRMGGDWYLEFAGVRRGSFLPRRKAAENEWKEKQPKKKRGRPAKNLTWHHLQHTSIIFLHWIGFDPRSPLSPPNDETTQALGFLAYDFFGKIVEKVC